ncbi:sulfotransferase [Synechococcus sp. KORDI-49]|uniref:sulfotransferase family protein n=1 Tax=Synechococcus sp. KORDI-49 TaxID=585423 RepID=UPI0012EB5F8D|nr:sulfotransferase [Synechococcus sp. KORDI-49]
MSHVIYVVGQGRSGTSLLHVILSCHNDFYGIPEEKFTKDKLLTKGLPVYLGKYIDINGSTPDNFVIKSPLLISCIPTLLASSKGFKISIVQTIRNPCNVYNSRIRADWSRSQHLMRHFIAIYSQYSAHYMNRFFFPHLMTSVKYEHLIEKPEDTIKQILLDLNLDFDPKCFCHHQHFPEQLRPRVDELQWKKNISSQIKSFGTNDQTFRCTPQCEKNSDNRLEQNMLKLKKALIFILFPKNHGLMTTAWSCLFFPYIFITWILTYLKYR